MNAANRPLQIFPRENIQRLERRSGVSVPDTVTVSDQDAIALIPSVDLLVTSTPTP